MSRYELSRRELLRRAANAGGGLLAAGAGASLLAACGDDGDDPGTASASSPAAANLGDFRLQLSWVPTAIWAADYIAVEQKLFQKAGLTSVELLHGGPQVTPEPLVAAGDVNMALSVTARFAAAVMNGAPLVAVGMDYQRSTYCVSSLPDNPIRTPDDLPGKRIGVQAISEGAWATFLQIAGIDPSSITRVPLQADPSLLTSGQIDGHLGFANNTPVVLRAQGIEPVVMMLSDHGFVMLEQPFVVNREELATHRDRVLAGLKAELAARRILADDHQLGVDLSVHKYAADADITPELAADQIEASLALATSPTTEEKGFGYLDPEDVAGTIETLALAGVTIDETAFDASLLDEIYADGPTIAL